MNYLFIFLQYFLQIFGYSFAYLLIAFTVLRLLKIKDSQVKIFIFLLALMKPPFVLARLIDLNSGNFYSQHSFFYFISRMISRFSNFQSFRNVNFILINNLVFGSYGIAIIVITLLRFYQTYGYFYKLKKEGFLVESEDNEVNGIISHYSDLMGIKTPKIYFTSDLRNSFYTFGFKTKKIIANKEMLDFLTKDEKETILLHELSHVKRNDSILNAIITYLTDAHFYSPFTYISYSAIKAEQEKDCDKFVIKYSQKTGKEVAINILTSILKIKKNLSETANYSLNLASHFSFYKPLEEASMRRRINSLINTNPLKIRVNILTKITLYCFFLALLFF